MNMKENYVLFFAFTKWKKKRDKNPGSHIFRASMYSFDFNTAIYRNCERSLEYRAETMFQNDEVSEQRIFRRVVTAFFFLVSRLSLGFRASVRIVAHRRSRRDYLARGGPLSQTGVFARRETCPRKFRICIKALVFAADATRGRGFRDGDRVEDF